MRRRTELFARDIDAALAAAAAEGIRIARGQFVAAIAAEVTRLTAIAKEHDKRWLAARALVENDDAEVAPDVAAANVVTLRQARLHGIQSKCAAETAYSARLITRETCSIDHVIPRAKGGDDNPDNLVLACRVCNLQRYDFGTVPPRALRAGRSAGVCEAEIARQVGIAVGRGTAANAAARDLAVAWFGAYIEKNRRYLAKRRASRVDAAAFPFGYAA